MNIKVNEVSSVDPKVIAAAFAEGWDLGRAYAEKLFMEDSINDRR